MIFACLIAALLCTTLLATTLADETVSDEIGTQVTEDSSDIYAKWDALSEERQAYCFALIDNAIKCPVDSYPLVAPVYQLQFSDSENADKRTNLFDTASNYGAEKTCEEFKGYWGCFTNMEAKAMEECGDDGGRGYAFLSQFMFYLSKPLVKTGVKLCTEDLNLLSEHFECLTNYELFTRIVNCTANHDDTTAALQCVNDEINKTEGCKEGAGDLVKEIVDILKEELREVDEWLEKRYSY